MRYFPPFFFFISIQRKKMFTVFLAFLATSYFFAPLVTSCFKKHSAKFEQYDDGRQKYIVKSVMKSVILALLCPYGMWVATVGSWNNDAITFTCNIALATAPPSLELGFCMLKYLYILPFISRNLPPPLPPLSACRD